ncbi:MAG: hypothetical protein AB1489_00110 [Acidobacteriota bacterium]
MLTRQSILLEVLRTASIGLLVAIFCLLLLYQDPYFFWCDDYQAEHLPALWDIARGWQEGELPLLSPYSWFGGALAAEYQYGVLSLSTSLIFFLVWKLQLSLPTTAALFSIIHLSITAAGAFRLARQRALSTDLSMMVGLVAALNGWLILWGAAAWTPGLTSFAWLPWAWWGLEGSLQEGNSAVRCILAGFFIYLILTAGWPFTLLMIGLITVWLALRQWRVNHSIKRLSRLAVAWLIALGLAAPALLMLIEYSKSTLRLKTDLALQNILLVPKIGLLGLILPAITLPRFTFIGWQLHTMTELACGLAPAVLLITSLLLLGRKYINKLRWEVGLFAIVLLLSISPSLWVFRWSFRWLPLFHLLLALLAAEGLALIRADNSTKQSIWSIKRLQTNCGIWSLLLLLIALLVTCLFYPDANRQGLSLGIYLLLISAGWALVEQIAAPRSLISIWMPLIVTLLSFFATYQHFPRDLLLLHWKFPEALRKTAPLDATIRYMSLYECDLLLKSSQSDFGTILRPSNTPYFGGVEFINGYTPMFPLGFKYIFQFGGHGCLSSGYARLVLQKETDPEGLLALMGVDGLVISNSLKAEAASLTERGWRMVTATDEGMVFHREGLRNPRVRVILSATPFSGEIQKEALNWLGNRRGPVAPVLLTQSSTTSEPLQFAPIKIRPVKETRLRAIAEVEPLSSSGESLVLFSRPWYPGYRATLNGKEVPVEIVNFIMPAVRLPAGAQGELILEYRPNSFVIGSGIALATILLTVLGLGWMLWQRRPAMVAANQTA